MMTTIPNYAATYYNLPSNPCDRAGHIGKRTRSMSFWTIEQYNQFIQYITDISAHTALQLLFYSGMRFGELRALTLADFNFKDNTINITKSLQHKASGDIVTPPKTDNGIRTITMPEAIMQEIEDYTHKIYGIKPSDRAFTFTKSLIRGNGTEKAGIPFIHIYDMRHPYVKPTTKNYFLSSNSCNSSILSRKWHSTGERISSCLFRYFLYSPCAFSRACLCVTLPFVVKISLLVIFR